MFESEIESFNVARENVYKFTVVTFCLTVSIFMKHILFILIFTKHEYKSINYHFPYAS